MLPIFFAVLSLSKSLPPGAVLPLKAAEIMRRVADNQDREQAARNQFIYQQIIHRTIRHKNGKLIKEEFLTYRPAYEIRFHPIDPHDYGWIGEAWIDEEEFQPVHVYTQLSRKLPMAVRTILGSDVHGLGLNVQYTRVDKDIWFPATYGTEFGVHALFLFNRILTESTENTNFRRATVDTNVEYSK